MPVKYKGATAQSRSSDVDLSNQALVVKFKEFATEAPGVLLRNSRPAYG